MNINVFIPLIKADAAKREVWGVAAIEQPDLSREIMDYAKSKPHFLAWSDRMKKASGGKSLGNVREGHTTNAVGKIISLRANDLTKAIEVGIKVVDDNAWKKVEEGVFTGFSIGGAYGERWQDSMNKSLTRYEAKPNELSLVDVPCIPGATFEMVKADGAVVQKQFPPKEEDPKDKPAPAEDDGKQDPKQATPPAEGDNSSDQSQEDSNQSSVNSDQSQSEEPTNGEDEQSAADNAEDSAEGKMQEEPASVMNAESVKQVVIQLLLELGLVQDAGGAFKAAQNADLQKVSDQYSRISTQLQKSFDAFKSQIVGDVAKVVVAVEALEKRGASGPVLRETAPITPQQQADTQRADLLKKMAEDTSDPTVKQSLMLEASRLEIKKIQNT